MRDLLRQLANRPAARPFVHERTANGWRTTPWGRVYALAAAAAAHATGLRGAGPVVLVLGNSASGAAVLLGLLAAGVDVLCLEPGTSHLTDSRSAVYRTGPGTVVVPVAEPSVTGPVQLDYQALLSPAADGPPPGPPDSEPAVLQLTSGSTGEPRIARQPLGCLLRGAELYRGIHRYTEHDKVLVSVPFAHSFGLVGGLLAALIAGAEVLTVPRFGVRALHDGLARGATVVLGSPLVYELLGASAGARRPGVPPRVLLCSGGPLNPETGTLIERRIGTPVRQVYGSTETGLIACQDDRAETRREGSVGAFAPGVEWRIADDDAATARSGAGRLLVRTATMFTGYQGSVDPPASRDGFYDTGDLVRVDESGVLTVLARKNTFVNVGGRKVNPRRVERIIAESAVVRDVHVFGRAQDFEEVVHAALVLAPGRRPTAVSDVLAHCRARLAPHEVPRHLHVLSELPRTSLGKVNLVALLDRIPTMTSRGER